MFKLAELIKLPAKTERELKEQIARSKYVHSKAQPVKK